MESAGLLERIEEWSVDQLRGYCAHHHPEDYQLIDVRQLQRYETERLPGSLWIPAEELPTRLDKLSTDKTTIVYCDQGALSRAAAQILVKSGFSDGCRCADAGAVPALSSGVVFGNRPFDKIAHQSTELMSRVWSGQKRCTR